MLGSQPYISEGYQLSCGKWQECRISSGPLDQLRRTSESQKGHDLIASRIPLRIIATSFTHAAFLQGGNKQVDPRNVTPPCPTYPSATDLPPYFVPKNSHGSIYQSVTRTKLSKRFQIIKPFPRYANFPQVLNLNWPNPVPLILVHSSFTDDWLGMAQHGTLFVQSLLEPELPHFNNVLPIPTLSQPTRTILETYHSN